MLCKRGDPCATTCNLHLNAGRRSRRCYRAILTMDLSHSSGNSRARIPVMPRREALLHHCTPSSVARSTCRRALQDQAGRRWSSPLACGDLPRARLHMDLQECLWAPLQGAVLRSWCSGGSAGLAFLSPFLNPQATEGDTRGFRKRDISIFILLFIFDRPSRHTHNPLKPCAHPPPSHLPTTGDLP